jgi:class 3 adenylate cyclase
LATGRVERRLAAILAADVAGYPRLMGADEEGTYLRLKAHFGQLVYLKINNHGGPHRQEYRGRPAGGISECSRGGAVCCRNPTRHDPD